MRPLYKGFLKYCTFKGISIAGQIPRKRLRLPSPAREQVGGPCALRPLHHERVEALPDRPGGIPRGGPRHPRGRGLEDVEREDAGTPGPEPAAIIEHDPQKAIGPFLHSARQLDPDVVQRPVGHEILVDDPLGIGQNVVLEQLELGDTLHPVGRKTRGE